MIKILEIPCRNTWANTMQYQKILEICGPIPCRPSRQQLCLDLIYLFQVWCLWYKPRIVTHERESSEDRAQGDGVSHGIRVLPCPPRANRGSTVWLLLSEVLITDVSLWINWVAAAMEKCLTVHFYSVAQLPPPTWDTKQCPTSEKPTLLDVNSNLPLGSVIFMAASTRLFFEDLWTCLGWESSTLSRAGILSNSMWKLGTTSHYKLSTWQERCCQALAWRTDWDGGGWLPLWVWRRGKVGSELTLHSRICTKWW